MENNLTDKEFKTLKKWAEKYGIVELKIKDKEKIFNLKKLYIANIKSITNNDNDIKHIPVEVFKLTNLEVITISSDDLTELPKEIENLINQKTFY